jgi:cysteine desulfurase
MTDRTYLDWNATAPLRPAARDAMLAALALAGNPSSVHAEGREARRVITAARRQVAALVGADPRNVVFTSGGTEANALALAPGPCSRLIVSAVEHSSVLAGGRFSAVEQLAVTADGVVDLAALELSLRSGARALVSVMAANNETGVIQPIAAVADLVRHHDGVLHVDAVQAAGRIALDMAELGADLLTLSAHKIGGPKGAGALVRASEDVVVVPLLTGGGQEFRFRAGTENVAAIAGFGAAAAAIDLAAERAHMLTLRERLETGLRAITPEAVIFGSAVDRLPNTTLVAVPGGRAETLVIGCDLAGVAVSSGSACSSGKVAPSHVLAAMGVAPDLARGALRLSTGPASTESDIETMLNVWRNLRKSLSKPGQGLAA